MSSISSFYGGALGGMLGVSTIISVYFVAELVALLLRFSSKRAFVNEQTFRRRAVVVVGGDFARSPRMQYHASSLRNSSFLSQVHLIGFQEGNRLCEALQTNGPDVAALDTSGLVPPLQVGAHWLVQRIPSKRLQWLVVTFVRVGYFIAKVWLALRHSLRMSISECCGRQTTVIPSVILIQTPPAVPFVPLVKVARVFFGLLNSVTILLLRSQVAVPRPSLIVDWHNFGFTLLKIDNRPPWIVAVYRWFEKYLCEGDQNLTVSNAMKLALTSAKGHPHIGSFNLKHPVRVLYDAAPNFFKPVDRSAFVSRLSSPGFPISTSEAPAWFRDGNEDGITVVSSTSWGSDDDYSMVVEALVQVDKTLNDKSSPHTSRNLWLVVTGRGPTRSKFEEHIARTKFSTAISVTTVYFQSFADYSMMLGVADIGLSVHFSSSGLDLPMKCVDMLGAGLPVAAVEYATLSELITSEKGWTFRTSEGLCEILLHLMTGSGKVDLETKSKFVVAHRERWEDNWEKVVLPIVQR